MSLEVCEHANCVVVYDGHVTFRCPVCEALEEIGELQEALDSYEEKKDG